MSEKLVIVIDLGIAVTPAHVQRTLEQVADDLKPGRRSLHDPATGVVVGVVEIRGTTDGVAPCCGHPDKYHGAAGCMVRVKSRDGRWCSCVRQRQGVLVEGIDEDDLP